MTDEEPDQPFEPCPSCHGLSLTPVDDVFTEVERRVFEDSEMWACACGHSESRPAT